MGAAQSSLDENPVLFESAMAVGKPHRIDRNQVGSAAAVERCCGNQDILGLTAIGAGIHTQPAADRPRDSGEEFKPGDPGLGSSQRDVEVERPGAGHHFAPVDGNAGKAAAQPDRDTGKPAVADQ